MGDFKRARQRAKEIRKGLPPEQSEILSQTEKDTQEIYARREAIINDIRRFIRRSRVVIVRRYQLSNPKTNGGVTTLNKGCL